MALDNISLSDIGKSLAEIDSEIKSLTISIESHKIFYEKYMTQRKALQEVAKQLTNYSLQNFTKDTY